MNRIIPVISLIILVLFMAPDKANCQNEMPEILIKGSAKEQINFIQERTRIYENYRAIREDMFQKLRGNLSDSLTASTNKISALNVKTSGLKTTIDSLNSKLATSMSDLAVMTETKNSIRVAGFEFDKKAYNSAMWLIIIGLTTILVMGFLIFKKTISVTINTKKELNDLRNEFESYRKTSRETREKLEMAHFLEIKKLKGK
jgi:chaperonin cofactor prefoldin